MKKHIIQAIALFISLSLNHSAISAQEIDKLDLKTYGQVRADLFYNSRASYETVDGLFYSYPKDHDYDAAGEDLNAVAQGGLYVLYARLGVDASGLKLGRADVTAKVEFDFRGSGTSYTVARLRHAYINFDWGKSSLLIGQTWHPIIGDVSSGILNLSNGAPYQPFNRSPLIRYRYKPNSDVRLTAAAIWQMQYCSAGPEGKSNLYLKNSTIPELYAGVDFMSGAWLVGAGAEMISQRPRLKANVDDAVYKVNERITTFSADAHVKYVDKDWTASLRTVLASNLTHMLAPGGYGVTEMNPKTGECKYTPFRHSLTWLSFIYGHKWRPGVFLGYLKNLGTDRAIVGNTYGVGLDIDCIYGTNWQITYNVPHWKFGAEFSTSTACYGTLDKADGRVKNTHSVTNYRIMTSAIFMF